MRNKTIKTAVITLAALALNAQGQTLYRVATGTANWTQANTWSDSSGGSPVAYSENNHLVWDTNSNGGTTTLDGTRSALSLTFDRTQTIALNGDRTLNVAGDITGSQEAALVFSSNNTTNNRTLTLNTDSNVDLLGRFNNNSTAVLNVNFGGAGTLTLSSATAHTSTGTATVTAGGLVVNSGTAFTSYTVNSAATLGGNNTLSAITLNNGGFLQAGSNLTAGTIGTLSATSLTWNGGGTLRWDLSATPGTSDLLDLGGAFTRGTAGVFDFDFRGFNASAMGTYTLIEFGSTNFTATDFSATNITYDSGLSGQFVVTGDSLQFAVIPEPGTLALVGIALGSLLLFRRRG